MSKETVLAWQARDIARAKVFEQITQSIVNMEDKFENRRLGLYRLVLHLIDRKLFGNGTIGTVETVCEIMSMKTFLGIPWNSGISMFYVLADAVVTIQKFQRAPEEGNALWAEIFTWAATQIASHHLSVLQSLEMSNPQLIFGAESAMTEVPIE